MAKACAQCSRKKIRCDGQPECANCRNSGSECVYKGSKERKSRVKKVESISDRLSRLEELVLKIATKIDAPGVYYSSSLPAPQAGSPDSTKTSPYSDTQHYQSRSTSFQNEKPGTQFFQQCKSIINESLDHSMKSSPARIMTHYKGSHFGFTIFSEKSTEYIRSKLLLEDYDITVPLLTFPYYFDAWQNAFQSVWSEPQVCASGDIAKLRQGVFPENKELVFELLRFYKHVHVANLICDSSTAINLFNSYYASKDSAQKLNTSYSELMLMSLILATCLSLATDREVMAASMCGDCPSLSLLSTSQLVSLQEEMFMNSVYYYHRISAISEGFPSIQALLIMSIYLETSWVFSDVNFTLVSLAIRYAQDIGLHRFETSAHLLEPEQLARLKLLAVCQYMDVETCYRLGKPPLLTLEDDSVIERIESRYDMLFQGQLSQQLNASCIGCPLEDEIMIFKVFRRLAQLRLMAFYKLFNRSLAFESVRDIQEIVDFLNTKLFEFLNSIDESVRPKFFNEPGFDDMLQKISSGLVFKNVSAMVLSMTYFSHLMTINRVPWQVIVEETINSSYEKPDFRRLSLDSARTILHLVRIIDRKTWPFLTLNWILIFPFLAAMNLCANCMNHTNDKETIKDLSLLIDVSLNFFGYFGSIARDEVTRLHYMRFQLMDLLVRVILRIVIKVVEKQNNMNVLETNAVLKVHLEHVETEYPHIFKKVNGLTNMTQIFCQAPLNNFFVKSNVNGLSPPKLNTDQYRNDYDNPRVSPSVANIMEPEFNDKRNEMPGEEELNYMGYWAREMTNMPNFFFDNGL